MTLYLPLIILVAVVIVISVILDRRWQARQAAKRSESTEEAQTGPTVTSRITGQFEGVRDRFGGRKQAKLAKQFQAWAAENITDNEALKDWVTDLPEEGAKVLIEQLAAFGADLNLEVPWLIEGKLDQDPELRQVAQRVVVSYCSACWQAALVQSDLEAFRTLQALVKAPTSKKHRELIQALYIKLVDEDMVSPPHVGDVFLAAVPKRLKQAVVQIQQAAEEDRKRFNEILKSVMEESNAEASGDDAATEPEEASETAAEAQEGDATASEATAT